MKTALKLLFAAIFLWMTVLTIRTSLTVSLWSAWDSFAANPWAVATLYDAYFGFITFWVWVAYKENTLWSRLVVAGADSGTGQHRHVALRAHPTFSPETGPIRGGTIEAMNNGFTLVLIGAASVAALMLLLWLIHCEPATRPLSTLVGQEDLLCWECSTLALGGGYWLRCALIGTMSAIWGLRLAIYLLATRIIGHPEEGRYQEMRRQWKTNIRLKFLLFYEFQALLCVVLAVPFLVASRNHGPWNIVD